MTRTTPRGSYCVQALASPPRCAGTGADSGRSQVSRWSRVWSISRTVKLISVRKASVELLPRSAWRAAAMSSPCVVSSSRSRRSWVVRHSTGLVRPERKVARSRETTSAGCSGVEWFTVPRWSGADGWSGRATYSKAGCRVGVQLDVYTNLSGARINSGHTKALSARSALQRVPLDCGRCQSVVSAPAPSSASVRRPSRARSSSSSPSLSTGHRARTSRSRRRQYAWPRGVR